MDGTAGRQFSTLRRRLQQLGIELVITHLPPARCVQGTLDLRAGLNQHRSASLSLLRPIVSKALPQTYSPA